MWFITRPPESRTRIFSIAKPALKTRPCFYLFLNFFLWPGSQAVATRQDYSYAVKPGTFAGATTVAAKSGEIIILWATGFGPTTPSALSGVSVPGNGSYPTATSPTVTIGNHGGDCLWLGARARLGRLVPDRDPGSQYARRWRAAHSGGHRRRSLAHRSCPFGRRLIKETMIILPEEPNLFATSSCRGQVKSS